MPMTSSSVAYKDLRGYLDAVDKLGELRFVNGADWDLEVGAITEVAARAAHPKVVLFDNIKDYPKGFRVVTNPVCSAPTTALAFGLDPKLTGMNIIRAWKDPSYRAGLSATQLAQLPAHPAGAIELPEPTLHGAWPYQGFRVKSGIRAGLSDILSGIGARLAVPT